MFFLTTRPLEDLRPRPRSVYHGIWVKTGFLQKI